MQIKDLSFNFRFHREGYIMDEKLKDSVSKMIVNGNRLELPKDDVFENYSQVKKALIDAGGKYKKCGFEFKEDAEEIKSRLVGGELINDKKKFQFFATPVELVEQLIDLAGVTKSCRTLEPSAGQGAIASRLKELGGECVTVELMEQNVKALKRLGFLVIEGDFLTKTKEDLGLYDKIVANPPFTKNQDIDHIKNMFALLSPNGKLVSIASKSWTFGNQKKQVAFREWLDDVGADVTEIPAGAFKYSGTNISSVIIEITAEG